MNLPEALTEKIATHRDGMNFTSKAVEDFVAHEHPVYIDREFKDAFISHLKDTSERPESRFKNSIDMMSKLTQEKNEMVSHLIIKALSKCEASAENFFGENKPIIKYAKKSLLEKVLKLVALLATPSGATALAIIAAVALVLLDQASLPEILQILKSLVQ